MHHPIFEDVPKGVESAHNAGMKAMVLTTMHGQHEFGQFDNVLGFHDDYTEMALKQ